MRLKPFWCWICKYPFQTWTGFFNHFKREHPKELGKAELRREIWYD